MSETFALFSLNMINNNIDLWIGSEWAWWDGFLDVLLPPVRNYVEASGNKMKGWHSKRVNELLNAKTNLKKDKDQTTVCFI